MPPELENLLRQVQVEGTLNAKDFVSSIFFAEDSDYIKEFRNDFKNKFVQPLSRQLRNVKPEDLKKILDPFGISDSAEDLAEDFKKYRDKIKQFLDIDLPEVDDQTPKEKLKDTNLSAAIPDKVQETNIGEQKTFGPKITAIEFSDGALEFLHSLGAAIAKQVREGSTENWRMVHDFKNKHLENQEKLISLSEGTGILGTLAKVLAIGGVGALLLSTFWESHIKPWLEETFDINLDFFNKLEGFVEGIGKFFTMGAVGAGGLILKIQGKVFSSIADVLDNSIGAVLKTILGESAGSGAGKIISGGAKVFSGSFFARIAGNLFKGLSIVALKSIPIIGGLISLGFAIDRFGKGDYIGGVIDLVGGLADLLYFTPLAPLGLAISLGAAGLNAFLDLKYGGTGDRAAENKAKAGFFGNIASGVFNFLKKIPIIGGMIDGVAGLWNLLYSLAGGDQAGVRSALEQMSNFPLLGTLPSILLAFLDVTDSSYTGEAGNRLSLPNFLQAFKKRVGQTVLRWFSWLPTSWQKSIADFMGVPFNGEEENDTSVASNPQTHKKTIDNLKKTDVNQENIEIALKNRDMAIKDYEETVRKRDEQDGVFGKYITGKYEIYEKMANNLADEIQILNQKIMEYQKENAPYSEDDNNKQIKQKLDQMRDDLRNSQENSDQINSVKVEDFYKPASGKSTLIFDQDSQTKFQTSPNDDVLAMKPNGIFDKSLKDLKLAINEMNKNMVLIGKGLNENKNINTSSVNISNATQNTKEYLFENTRDPIFADRTNWWNLSQRTRSTI
jgi:hypothetical protein